MCKIVFIATGSQTIRNDFIFLGENKFHGIVAFSSNALLGDEHKTFKGKTVCIFGGRAFAIENVKTALLHGAKDVMSKLSIEVTCKYCLVGYIIICLTVYQNIVRWGVIVCRCRNNC